MPETTSQGTTARHSTPRHLHGAQRLARRVQHYPRMTTEEAKAFGKRVRRLARAAVERGDVAPWFGSDAEWHLAEWSHELGIVGSDGVIAVEGEVARAFRSGFKGK